MANFELNGLRDRIKERKAAKQGGSGNNDSFAEKMLFKKFGEAFKKVTPAQKKQLITLYFSPIPPLTKRALMLRIIKKGAFSKDNIKTALKTAGRFATGGASLIAERIAKKVKAKKAARNAELSLTEKSFDDDQRESFDDEKETMLDNEPATQIPATATRRRGRRSSTPTSIATSSGAIAKKIQQINSQTPTQKQSNFDIKQYIIPLIVGAGALYFVTKKTGKK